MTDFIKKLLNLIYPKELACVVCNKELVDGEREYALCKECQSKLETAPDALTISNNVKVYSCFRYDKIARYLVLSYKDSDKPYISEYMAKFMRNAYVDNKLSAEGIVYVPSNKKKINKRGYDALKFVADYLAEYLTIPVIKGLEKKKGGQDLTVVAREKRLEQVKDSFFVRDNSALKDKKILLIDDVITTSATLNECVKALLSAGVKSINVITFSRAVKI